MQSFGRFGDKFFVIALVLSDLHSQGHAIEVIYT